MHKWSFVSLSFSGGFWQGLHDMMEISQKQILQYIAVLIFLHSPTSDWSPYFLTHFSNIFRNALLVHHMISREVLYKEYLTFLRQAFRKRGTVGNGYWAGSVTWHSLTLTAGLSVLRQHEALTSAVCSRISTGKRFNILKWKQHSNHSNYRIVRQMASVRCSWVTVLDKLLFNDKWSYNYCYLWVT